MASLVAVNGGELSFPVVERFDLLKELRSIGHDHSTNRRLPNDPECGSGCDDVDYYVDQSSESKLDEKEMENEEMENEDPECGSGCVRSSESKREEKEMENDVSLALRSGPSWRATLIICHTVIALALA